MKKLIFIITLFTTLLYSAQAQNVGIGTTTPAAQLHIKYALPVSVNDIPVLVLDNPAGGTQTSLQFRLDGTETGRIRSDFAGNMVYSATGAGKHSFRVDDATEMLTIDGVTGRTGIGITSPTEKLDVNGTVKATGITMTTGASNGYILQSDASGNASWVPATALGTSVWTVSGNDIYKNNTGNVGIGTSMPAAPLHIQYAAANNIDGTPAMVVDNPSGGTQTSIHLSIEGSERGRVRADANGNMFYASTGAGGHYFKGNGDLTDLVTITSAGRLGIGTSSPSSLLHVYSSGGNTAVNVQSVSNSAYINLNAGLSGMESSIAAFTNGVQRWSFGKSNTTESGSNTGSDFFINRYTDAGTFVSQPVVIRRSTGYVGINQGNAAHQLDVNGNVNVNSGSAYYIGSAKVLSINGSDNVLVGVSAGSVISSGSSNTFIGKLAGDAMKTGSENTVIGYAALNSMVNGNRNVAVGYGAGFISTGINNTFLGHSAGSGNTGNGSIFIGYQAGSLETDGNKLYIENSLSTSPLIYGDFSKDSVSVNGSFTIEGAMGLKVRTGQTAGTNNPNVTAGIWIYSSGTGTIDLGVVAYTDRLMVIINNTGASRNISSYRDLSNTAQTTIANNTSLWLVYDGTNWRQIK